MALKSMALEALNPTGTCRLLAGKQEAPGLRRPAHHRPRGGRLMRAAGPQTFSCKM